jgi:hypothetical protein
VELARVRPSFELLIADGWSLKAGRQARIEHEIMAIDRDRHGASRRLPDDRHLIVEDGSPPGGNREWDRRQKGTGG